MIFSARARATQQSAVAPNWLHTTTHVAIALGACLFAQVPLEGRLSVQPAVTQGVTVIAKDAQAKSAARDAKRAERAAAREAKKRDHSLAKAKSAKKSSGSSSVDLGDNDPLDGL